MCLALNSAESESSLDVKLKSVLPGVHVWFSNIEGKIEQGNQSLHQVYNQQVVVIAANVKRHSQFVEASCHAEIDNARVGWSIWGHFNQNQ
jgi:hypothetical protein